MKKFEGIKQIIRKNKRILEDKYNVKMLGIFGSYASGYQRKNSDIDILVEFLEPPDFFGFIRLEAYLKRLLGIKVDLVTRNALKPIIKKEILKGTILIS